MGLLLVELVVELVDHARGERATWSVKVVSTSLQVQTMRAAQLSRYGAPDVLSVVSAPRPTPGKGEVLVAVKASSVNPIDCKIRAGTQRAFIRYQLPRALGLDVSGEVAALGEGVQGWAVGDEVFAVNDYRKPGCYAEFTVVPAALLARKPASCTHAQAAALPLVGLTAWQALVTVGKLQPGQRVLIQAGAGGVGTIAIQLAAHLGAHVITTCSARNADFVRGLGAHEVIDYNAQPFEEALRDAPPLDLVLDALGGAARARALPLLRRGGKLVSIVSDIPEMVGRYGAMLGAVAAVSRLISFRVRARLTAGVSFSWIVMKPSGAQLSELARLVEGGHVKPVIDRCFPLHDIVAAHALSDTHHAKGKVVIEVG
jgi:NADPH:quinone reductase-like Zn-dependent oxidoreductase